MYKLAEQKINEGLSPVARYILAFFSGMFGIVMILIAPSNEKGIFFYMFGAFCLLITVVSFIKGKTRQFVGSIIGSLLFILSVWYIVAQVTGGPFLSSSRAEPSIVNSVFFLFAFGVPGISYALKTKFGCGSNENRQP